MTSTNDGFRVAEEDLAIRGPGDFFGKRQHGLPEMRIASFSEDVKTLKTAQSAAAKLLAEDPMLEKEENRLLRKAVKSLSDRLEENRWAGKKPYVLTDAAFGAERRMNEERHDFLSGALPVL